MTVDRDTVESFLFREARLLDEHRYREWEELWADDGVYWIPSDDVSTSPDEHVALVYDDRELIAARVRRLEGRYTYAQQPRSRVTRVISNVELGDGTDVAVHVRSSFVLHEWRTEHLQTLAGRLEHDLRVLPDAPERGLEIVQKKVALVNASAALPNIVFLL